jgi:hypothetical protein
MTRGIYKRISEHERFFNKVEKTSECWNWMASKNQKGYGQFCVNGKTRLAHRYSYLNYIGSIPEGKVLDHICRNKGCVNPNHLRPLTIVENAQRDHILKTHCIKGHELIGENIYYQKNGKKFKRTCNMCRKISGRGLQLLTKI